jgi:hypothetical protein
MHAAWAIRFVCQRKDFLEPLLIMRDGEVEDWMIVDLVVGQRLSPQAFV